MLGASTTGDGHTSQVFVKSKTHLAILDVSVASGVLPSSLGKVNPFLRAWVAPIVAFGEYVIEGEVYFTARGII